MQVYDAPALELMHLLLLSIPGDTVEVLHFQSKVSHRPGTALMYMTSEAGSCFTAVVLWAIFSPNSQIARTPTVSNLHFVFQPNASINALSPALINASFFVESDSKTGHAG